jgi:hypothetical protein
MDQHTVSSMMFCSSIKWLQSILNIVECKIIMHKYNKMEGRHHLPNCLIKEYVNTYEHIYEVRMFGIKKCTSNATYDKIQ